MLTFNLVSDLRKWTAFEDRAGRAMKRALAKSLNETGDRVLDETIEYLVRQTGLEGRAIAEKIKVVRADEQTLTWEMDASAIAPPSLDWSRPWAKSSDRTFEQQTLVKILTMEDDKVCPICEAAAENSPYTLEEAQQMFTKGGDKAGLHINCRCLIGPWETLRRIPVKFGNEAAPQHLFTVRQLGRKVAEEVRIELSKVVLR